MDLYLFYYGFDCSEVTQTTAFRLLLLISLLTHRTFGSLDVSIYVITQPDSLWKTTVPQILFRRYYLCLCTLLELIFPSTNMIAAFYQQPTKKLFQSSHSKMIYRALNSSFLPSVSSPTPRT